MDDLTTLELLQWAAQRGERLFRANIGDSGLTLRDVIILRVVARLPGLTQTDLMHGSGIDRSTTSDIVRRMVARGHIRRSRSKKDARIYVIRLTSHGRETLREAQRIMALSDTALLADWPPAEISAFGKSLRRLFTREP